jgi:hypothetical protein
MSLTAWAKYRQPADLTLDLLCAIVLFGLIALAIPQDKSHHSPNPTSRETSPQVTALQRAIIGQESGGQCSIQNRSGSRAAGLAQVMPENVTAWSQEALGRTVTLTEFLNDCQLQQQVIRFKLQQYWEEEIRAGDGDERLAVRRVASRWYSGRADLYDSSAPQFWNGDRYPSMREYTLSVLQHYLEICSNLYSNRLRTGLS